MQRGSNNSGCLMFVLGAIALALALNVFFGIGNLLDLTPTMGEISDEKAGRYQGLGVGIVLTLLVIAAPFALYFFGRSYLRGHPGDTNGLLMATVVPSLALILAITLLPVGKKNEAEFDKEEPGGTASVNKKPAPHGGPNNGARSWSRNHGRDDSNDRGEGRSTAIPDNAKRTTVVSVTDGDTVELAALGASRLIGVDTPEVYFGTECFGEKASAYTESRLGGATVFFVRGAETTDRYGRALVYLWLPGGTFFNAELIKTGYATPLAIPPNTDYATLFSRLAGEARRSDRGLWPKCGGADKPRGVSGGDGGKPSGGGGRCEPGYDPCVPSYPPDVDCADLSGSVSVSGSDPHALDADGDGSGCE